MVFEFRRVHYPIIWELFNGKIGPVFRDLQIFIVPGIVDRVERSRLVLVSLASRAHCAHNLVCHGIPVVTEKITGVVFAWKCQHLPKVAYRVSRADTWRCTSIKKSSPLILYLIRFSVRSLMQCFTTIKDAVAEAPTNCTILVHPGTYDEENTLDHKVTIIGTGKPIQYFNQAGFQMAFTIACLFVFIRSGFSSHWWSLWWTYGHESHARRVQLDLSGVIPCKT